MKRLWEIDAARTAAIAMMVAYHAAWNVWWLAPSVTIDPFGGGWRALQVATGSSFLTITGISFAVAHRRRARRADRVAHPGRAHVRRAAQVLGAAAVVSIATRVALGPDEYVRFGILHCIGTIMLLMPLLVRLGPVPNLVLAAPAIMIGKALETATGTVPGALLLGWRLPDGSGVDYYPLLPWIGPAMIGLALGLAAYPDGERGPAVSRLLGGRTPRARLTWPGRHALPIYLTHQPVLMVLVAVALLLAGITVDPGQR